MMNKKIALFAIAMVLLLGVTMGVTLALMTDKTEAVTNTFVAGTFGKLELKEANESGDEAVFYANGDTYEDDTFTGFAYTLTPGATLTKRVRVAFESKTTESVGAQLYVHLDTAVLNDTNTTAGWTFNSQKSRLEYYAFVGDNQTKILIMSAIVNSAWTPVVGSEFKGLLFTKKSDFNAKSNKNDSIVNSDSTEFISAVDVESTITEDDIAAVSGDSKLVITAYAHQTADVTNSGTYAAFKTAFGNVINVIEE